MQVGDLVRDIIDGDYYIIIGEDNCEASKAVRLVYRICDSCIDTRYPHELEVINESR